MAEVIKGNGFLIDENGQKLEIVDKQAREKVAALTEEMVKSINGLKPDANGNIMLPIYNGEGEVV